MGKDIELLDKEISTPPNMFPIYGGRHEYLFFLVIMTIFTLEHNQRRKLEKAMKSNFKCSNRYTILEGDPRLEGLINPSII